MSNITFAYSIKYRTDDVIYTYPHLNIIIAINCRTCVRFSYNSCRIWIKSLRETYV